MLFSFSHACESVQDHRCEDHFSHPCDLQIFSCGHQSMFSPTRANQEAVINQPRSTLMYPVQQLRGEIPFLISLCQEAQQVVIKEFRSTPIDSVRHLMLDVTEQTVFRSAPVIYLAGHLMGEVTEETVLQTIFRSTQVEYSPRHLRQDLLIICLEDFKFCKKPELFFHNCEIVIF